VTAIPIIPHFVILEQPSDVAAGAFMTPPISVEVEDQFNNPVTKGFSPAKLSIVSAPTGAKITGNSVPLKAGIATFTKLSFKTAGAYSLQVTDSTTPLLTVIDFSVLPGPATKMVFATQPALDPPIIANLNATTVVELEDKFGNIAVDDTSAVSLILGVHPKNSILTGVLTENVIDGLATFTDLSVDDVPGTYTIKATDSNPLPPVTSKPIKIPLIQPG
jgi:trimeric autotransporter adhesin